MTSHEREQVGFYNGRGTAELWTQLSCHDSADNQVRLQLSALARNMENFPQRLALPDIVKHGSLVTLREKLIRIGAKVVHHARSVVFQMAKMTANFPANR